MRIIISESELIGRIQRVISESMDEIYDAREEEKDEDYVIFDKNTHKMLHWGKKEDCKNAYEHTATFKNNDHIKVMRATDARKIVRDNADVTDKITDRNDGHK